MSLLVIGLSHRTAPVEVREKLAFSREELGVMVSSLVGLAGMEEGILLSTCNRTEVIAAVRPAGEPDGLVGRVRDVISSAREMDAAQLDQYLYVHRDHDAVRHLFRVASSLDSMMVGEPQILGQVKEAYSAATAAGAVGPRLEGLMQRTFSVAKRVRADTGISRHPISIAYAAVDLASRIFGSLEGRSVMLLGAGKMASLAARHLATSGARSVLVASRTFHHAQETAREFNGVPITIDRFGDYLPRVDIVIASTAAPGFVLTRPDAARLMRERRGRPIFFIDIAVPRDIEPACNTLDNLYLYDIDDLQAVVDAGLEERRREAVLAEAIVEEEVSRYHARLRSREASPAIVALRDRLHGVARDEMKRFRGRMGPLSEKQEAVIREMMESLVNKVVHGPTREMKRAGQEAGGEEIIAMVRRMFDLSDRPPGPGPSDAGADPSEGADGDAEPPGPPQGRPA